MSNNKLNIALIQSDLIWERPKENRQQLVQKINTISSQVDLVILSEMFTTGFSMNPEKNAETMEGESVTWMVDIAKQKNIALVGSIIIETFEEKVSRYVNRLLFVHPSGTIDFYDKKHTFTLAGEHEVYAAGTEKLIVDYKGWKICPLICYDLRFPVWSRNVENYDLLIYVASWPKVRTHAWDALLKARAIENMSYTIGVNRVGVDANNHEYSGNSVCYDALGACLVKNDSGNEAILEVTVDKEQQDSLRKRFNFLEDKDAFKLLN